MTGQQFRTLLISALAVAILGGGGALFFLERQCTAGGGQFVWTEVACEAGSRPVILQSDIHRV